MFTFKITTALTGTKVIQARNYDDALKIAQVDEYHAALCQCTQYDWASIKVEGRYKFRISFYGDMETWAVNLTDAQTIAIDTERYWAHVDGIRADTESTKRSVQQI